VPIDRASALRNAEKLLRQGKLDQAIAEYVRIVEDQPRDWNTANILGDLYVRAGQPDKAVEQFTRIADHLHAEGFFPKAGAVYKKVLKIKPEDEHALLQSAEVAASQGLLVEARQGFTAVAEKRRGRKDARGVAEIRIRVGTLDPDDVEARIDGARARAELGDAPAALNELKALAAELTEKNRDDAAVEVIREAATLAPDDEDLREHLVGIYIAAGDFERARECATTVEHFKALAAALEERGYPDHALGMLVEAAHLDPTDAALLEHLARAFYAKGDVESAAHFLTAESAGSDPELRLMLAEIQLRSGRIDDAVAVLKRLIDDDPSRREAIALLGWTIAEQQPDSGYPAVEVAAEAAVAQDDWAGAAAALQEFVTRVPNHIPALMRLVEICVDGGLEATMYSAQAQLADAYIASGAAAEARFIAEDLVAREPWERANVERFRQALVLLGETDPDGVIAERLSGQSPFMSTDLSVGEFAPYEEAAAFTPPSPAPLLTADPPSMPRAVDTVRAQGDVTSAAIDLDTALDDLERAASDDAEVDLTVVLDEFSSSPIEAEDIEQVFEHLRDEASKRSGESGDTDFRRALALRDAGEIDDAIQALESAARSPRFRFHAAALLGRIYRDKQALPQAIEWLERAAEASAPTAAESHFLLYELADALEESGEVARALAICLELQADAGEFKDVSARIDRLAKVQTRG